MVTFTNGGAVQVVLPALQELSEQSLPMRGVLQVTKILHVFAELARVVEEVRLIALKKYVLLDDTGEIAWQDAKTAEGKVVKRVGVYINENAEIAWGKEYVVLMTETFEYDDKAGKRLIEVKHLPKDVGGVNTVTADLLFRLGGLVKHA